VSVTVSCATDVLDVDVRGADRLWGLRSRLEIPLSRVTDARVLPTREAKADLWIRTGGLGVPGVAAVGHFRGRVAKKQWWRVYRAPEVLVIELAPESTFDRVVLQVDDPAAIAAEILRARSARP
jgi:hypothetical protein